ncbi:MAG: HD-GYP domain-containing protein (c-di-GMP phosphodiesterase class II) [Oleiphilaceae bacterium]
MKVEVNYLKEGMYIADLDCPWHKTPFPLQGFYIRKDDDVKALAGYCKFVYVDERKCRIKHVYESRISVKSKPKVARNVKEDAASQVVILEPLVIKSPQTYEMKTTIKKEVAKAGKLHQHVYEAIAGVFETLYSGSEVSIAETESVAEGMVESVLRNPDALVWLSKMSEEDVYTYQHSVKSSIWSLVFGRHLGLEKQLLKTLAMGVLLSHIGITKLPSQLRNNAGTLSEDEQRLYQSYVNYSVEMLEGMDDIPSAVVSIVKFYQERHNGTGYPLGVTGGRIPLLAKIAGLVDYYQSLIDPKDSSQGLSPLQAVSKLFEMRNIAFQEDLVERFIEAVGVYPTGTLVELSSHEVAIVTGHNLDRRLFPKIMIVLDDHKYPLKDAKLVDLKEWNQNKVGDEGLYISESLPKGAYNIDENEFLLTGAKSRWSWKHFAGSIAS